MKNEKKLRSAHDKNDGFAHTVGNFHGVNMAAGRHFAGKPSPNTPPANNLLSNGAPSDRGQQSPTIQTESLAKWVSAVKPDSVLPTAPPQEEEPPPPNIPTRTGRFHSVGSVGMISEAASRWDVGSRMDDHGRQDSCAASCWQQRTRSCHVSDGESSVNDEDNGDNVSFAGTGPRRHGRSRSSGNLSHNVWNGLGQTMDLGRTDRDFERTGQDFGLADTDLESSVELGTTASTTFFNDLAAPLYRPNDAFRVTHDEEDKEGEGDEGDREEHVRNHARSRGRMTEAASVLPTPHSQLSRSRQRMNDTMGGHGEAMSRWDGSPPSSPAGAVTISFSYFRGVAQSLTLYAFCKNHRLVAS